MSHEATVRTRVNVSGALLFKNAAGDVKEVPFQGQTVPMSPEEAQKVVESVEMELKRGDNVCNDSSASGA